MGLTENSRTTLDLEQYFSLVIKIFITESKNYFLQVSDYKRGAGKEFIRKTFILFLIV